MNQSHPKFPDGVTFPIVHWLSNGLGLEDCAVERLSGLKEDELMDIFKCIQKLSVNKRKKKVDLGRQGLILLTVYQKQHVLYRVTDA